MQINGSVSVSPSSVWVINEGNFQFGNASLGIYNPSDSTYVDEVFQSVNERPLGDVFQSVSIFNNRAYLVVNNSAKIEVINPQTLEAIGTVSGLHSPRYFLPLSQSKAYVSNYFSDSVAVLNLADLSIEKRINCRDWSEEMALVYGKVFITRPRSDYLLVVNAATDEVEDSVKLAYNSNAITEDKNGKLWVLCSGSQASNKPGGLFCIDPLSLTVEKSFSLPATENPSNLTINASLDTLYFLTEDVYRLPVEATGLPVQAFIPSGNQNFYGIDIHPHSHHIYVSDAIDFNQRGNILIYDTRGELINSFKGGLIPNGIFIP